MSIDKKEWKYEKEFLKDVLQEIKSQLNKNKEAVDRYKDDIIATQKNMWSEVTLAPQGFADLEDVVEAWQFQAEIDRQGKKYELYDKFVSRLNRMLKSPYFARIDFFEKGEKCDEKIYIGLSNLIEEGTGEYLIYDWRAPISSMFYDYEMGKAMYICPEGTIEGNILLKRQYRIKDGQIKYMFNSNLKIDDEILQEMLSRNVDNKMKTIVTTIQREQNRVIRDETHRLLLVHGPAGSGKTSIALHRIAYLLYRYRHSIDSENVVIFSPNQIFSDYISSVLPELGEENINRTTFRDYMQQWIEDDLEVEDMNEQMEYLLNSKNLSGYNVRVENIKYKTSKEFLRVIKNYVKYLEQEDIIFCDIIYRDNVIMTTEDMKKLILFDYKDFPLSIRLEKLRNRIFYLLKPYEAARAKELEEELIKQGGFVRASEVRAKSMLMVRDELRELRRDIRNLTTISIKDKYKKLFEDKFIHKRMLERMELPDYYNEIANMTIEQLTSNCLTYEDMAAFLLMKILVDGVKNTTAIKYVIIDEGQDYTAIQYEILRHIFKDSNLTILGDIKQSINPFMNIGKYENILDIFKKDKAELINLTKSYRSTKEIAAFCRGLQQNVDEVEYINREGDKPRVIYIKEQNLFYNSVVHDIESFKSQGYKSIAVICTTAQQSHNLYKVISEMTEISLITKDDAGYSQGTVIIPSYLSKGLEFDAVLVVDASEQNYKDEEERNLLYTVCTRALHQLNIYYTSQLTHFIKDIDKELYDFIEIN